MLGSRGSTSHVMIVFLLGYMATSQCISFIKDMFCFFLNIDKKEFGRN